MVGLKARLNREERMTLTIKKRLTILELIEALPVLQGKCVDGHKFIPWYELDDRLADIEPGEVKSCVKGFGGRIEFNGIGMTIFKGKQ